MIIALYFLDCFSIVCFFSVNALSCLTVLLDQEKWLKENVLAIFPDTRVCSPSLVR